MSKELLPCPFCGNEAITFEPDADRNIVSCRLGHARFRSIEGWNTRPSLWRPVSELPEEGKAVLWKLSDGRCFVGSLNGFNIDASLGRVSTTLSKVAGWMPLPEFEEKI